MKPPEELAKWIDLGFKMVVILGPFIWWILFNYLKTWFALKADFDLLVPRLDSIERTILLMANQRKELDDHEQRIRVLEKKL
jgi:hypothetical protein